MSFKQWMHKTFDDYQLVGITKEGANAGWPGLTHYEEVSALYRTFGGEIWERVEEKCDGQGYENRLVLISKFQGAGKVDCPSSFERLLVWFAAEEYAKEILDE